MESHREGLAGRVVKLTCRSVTGQSASTYRWCRYIYALKQEEKCRGVDLGRRNCSEVLQVVYLGVKKTCDCAKIFERVVIGHG